MNFSSYNVLEYGNDRISDRNDSALFGARAPAIRLHTSPPFTMLASLYLIFPQAPPLDHSLWPRLVCDASHGV
jgi:hypothetical protein